jgi:deazaflavin-dependent oxidoreductase (nitroreductase family)
MTDTPSASLWQRTVSRLVSSAAGATLGARTLHHLDRLALRLSRGRTTVTTLFTGLELLTLTTTGAKSGLPRSVPLLAIPHTDGQTIVIASNWGQTSHPAWYHNLIAHPEVSVTRNGQTRPYLARQTEGEERERCWQRALALYPGYAAYQRRAPRTIPVILLTPSPL